MGPDERFGHGDSRARGPLCRLTQLVGTALGEPTARILTAKFNPRSEARTDPAAPPWMGPVPPMPQHCEVIGVMRERTGTDGQHYAVKYHLRLPTDWNGRFLFQGGGGTNGELGAAAGALQPGMPTGLEKGFAVVSTDTGHDNARNNDAAKQGTGPLDMTTRHEWSTQRQHSTASLLRRSASCKASMDGRRATAILRDAPTAGARACFAQRYPDQFEGIVPRRRPFGAESSHCGSVGHPDV